MRSEATRAGEISVGGQVLYMALEPSERTWKVLFASATGRARHRAAMLRIDGPGTPAERVGREAARRCHRPRPRFLECAAKRC